MCIVFIWKNVFTFLSVCILTTHLFIIHVCTQVHAMKYRHIVNTGIMCKHLRPSRYCYTDLHTDACILGHMSRNICTYKYMYMHLPAHTYSIYVYTCLSISICISSCLSISIFIYLPVCLVCLSSYLPMYLINCVCMHLLFICTYLSIYLSVNLLIRLATYLPTYLFVNQSSYLSS